MSLNEKMTGLMNTIRTMSGTTDKLSVDDAMRITSSAGQWGVRVPNLISDSSNEYQLVQETTNNTKQLYSGAAKAGIKYSLHVTVKDLSYDTLLNIGVYDQNWTWLEGINGTETIPAGGEGVLHLNYTPKQDGFFQWSIMQRDSKAINCQYKCAMLNEGDYAPYTSATKPYTVDELANRLEKLENKLGGVVKALPSVLLPVRGCAA